MSPIFRQSGFTHLCSSSHSLHTPPIAALIATHPDTTALPSLSSSSPSSFPVAYSNTLYLSCAPPHVKYTPITILLLLVSPCIPLFPQFMPHWLPPTTLLILQLDSILTSIASPTLFYFLYTFPQALSQTLTHA